MSDPPAEARTVAERALAHSVPHLLPAEGGRPIVAASVAGDPPRARVAWVDSESGEVLARVACPPGRPSRGRPAVAASVEVEVPGAVSDRVLVCRVAEEVSGATAIVAAEVAPEPAEIGPERLVLIRLQPGAVVTAVDALDARGEPVGRLARAGIAELRSDGRAVSGRLGATHGMSAGFGAGAWKADLDEAAFEAGFTPVLPGWTPSGLEIGRPRVEPDVAYPSGPPSVVIAWSGEDGAQRVLVRQTVAPLASPAGATQWTREVDVNGATGHLSGRRLGLLVWERDDLAFGIQVRGIPHPDEVALRVGRSVPPA
jgi:hypothetical protein